MRTALFERLRQLGDFRRQKRLAAGDDNKTAWILGDFLNDLIDPQRPALWFPGSIGRVTPRAAQVAAGCPNKDGRNTDQAPLSLKRIEDLRNLHASRLTELTII